LLKKFRRKMSTNLKSTQWHDRALKVIPGGVSSPVRAFKSVGGTPRYFVKGLGSKIWDVDGNEYIDLVGSWGPMILGHANPYVVQKVKEALEKSFSFGAPGPGETLLAEEIISRVPVAERVRFVSSGTEAVMTAVRLARAATGRNKVVKFAGCYHGHSDSLLVQAGSGIVTLGLPNSPGVTTGQVEDTVILPYNDFESLEKLFSEHGPQIAAVITEAAPANMGVVPPLPGFNSKIAQLAKENGAVLILDEVMTGFRISRGGWWQKYGLAEDWVPDLFTFGKVIGGGLPLAAVAGNSQIMEMLAPSGLVYQAGTLSGNPVASAAGLATLELCDQSVYESLNLRAEQIGKNISEALRLSQIEHSYQCAGNLFSFFFCGKKVNNFSDAQTQNTNNFSIFFHSMLEQGVSIPPSAYEAWFVSSALTDSDVEKISIAANVAAEKVAQAQ
jgi:glutamate-1-semialdehyde 2,1-aminomutase